MWWTWGTTCGFQLLWSGTALLFWGCVAEKNMLVCLLSFFFLLPSNHPTEFCRDTFTTPVSRRSFPVWACRPPLNIDRFHQPCLLPWRTSSVWLKATEQGEVRTVIVGPRGGHLPVLQAAQLFLHASQWRVLHRQLDGTMAGRHIALLLLLCHPLFAKGDSTHAGSGPLRPAATCCAPAWRTPSTWPCAAVHNKLSLVMFAVWPRCDTCLLSCCVGRSEDFYMPEHKSLWPGIFLMNLDPSMVSLVSHLQYSAVLLPRASQTARVLKNWPTSTVFEKPASSEAITTWSCLLCGFRRFFFQLFFFLFRKHMVTHGTKQRIAGANDHLLHTSSVHGRTDDLPLRKLLVCGELTLIFLPDWNRYEKRFDCTPTP